MGSRGASSGKPPILKSSIGVERDNIRHRVNNELKGKSFNKEVIDENGKTISVEIVVKRDGIKHITNDIHKLKVIKQEDIHKLTSQLKHSSFIKSSPLKHTRKDNFDRFYYFKAQRLDLYFNIGRKTNKNGSVVYELYSITKKI